MRSFYLPKPVTTNGKWMFFKSIDQVMAVEPQGRKADGQRKYSPSTHDGLFLVVPATFPGRQEHFTVWDRSSMRFLLQHRCAAMTSHVPPSVHRHRHTHVSGWQMARWRVHLHGHRCEHEVQGSGGNTIIRETLRILLSNKKRHS